MSNGMGRTAENRGARPDVSERRFHLCLNPKAIRRAYWPLNDKSEGHWFQFGNVPREGALKPWRAV
jgi:hypothetical protein